MAVRQAKAALQFPATAQTTQVTLSPDALCHYIRDDELDKLGEMRKDLVMEFCLAATGIFFGALIPAIDGFRRFGADVNPSTATDLASMMLCFAALAVAIITGFQWRIRSKAHRDTVEEIRSRPKMSVRLVHDNP